MILGWRLSASNCAVSAMLTRRIAVDEQRVVPGRLREERVVVRILVVVRPASLGHQRLAERAE